MQCYCVSVFTCHHHPPVFQHAHALEQLKDHLFAGARVLDVGSGSGYLTTCMAHMVCTVVAAKCICVRLAHGF